MQKGNRKGNRLVVANEEWAKDLPEWLLKAIEDERIVDGMLSIPSKQKQSVGDAEVCAYLYTASLTAPLGNTMAGVYLKISHRLIARVKGIELPGSIGAGELSEDEKSELERLRRQLYKVRGGEVRSPLFDVLKKMRG